MAQRRFINFGDTVLASRINEISTAIVAPGVLSGGEFTIFDSSTLSVGPNTVMLQTLLLNEDIATLLPVPLTPDPKDYTVVYEHMNANVLGGVPAQMILLEGIFAFGALEDTVVLGWVQYPGGSVPLDVSFFIEAPKLQITNPTQFPSDILLPPYLDKIQLQDESPTPGTITQTNQYDKPQTKAFLELENTDTVIETIVHSFPFSTKLTPPQRIILETNSELGTSLTAQLVAEDGTVFDAENNVISNTSSQFEFREMEVLDLDESKFQPERPYFVSITSQLNPGRRVFISIVGTNQNFLPF